MLKPPINIGFLITLFALTAALSWLLYFRDVSQKDTVDIKKFPTELGGWTSEDLPITEQEYAILETHNAFVRHYHNMRGQDVYLYLVYSQNNRKVAHPPEICYTGSGLSILEDARDTIPVDYKKMVIKANRLTLESKRYQQISFYWFKVGDTFTPNYWKQQAIIAMKTLTGQHAGSALVRISSDVKNGDKASAIQNIKDFTRLITPDLFKYLP